MPNFPAKISCNVGKTAVLLAREALFGVDVKEKCTQLGAFKSCLQKRSPPDSDTESDTESYVDSSGEEKGGEGEGEEERAAPPLVTPLSWS